MTTSRRLLALAATVAAAGLVASTAAVPATARQAGRACTQRGPIAIGALPAASRSGCSLVGRMVTAGGVSVMVPPVGVSVAGDGVGRRGDVRGLTVTNTGTSVRAVREGVVRSGSGAATARAGSPAACKDRTFHLEGGHKWATRLRYKVNVKGHPKGLHPGTLIHQIRVANGNMRKGRNTCHKALLKTPVGHYLGQTKAKPNISPRGGLNGEPGCTGNGNTSNIVGFGNLGHNLLGWTCYWWGGNGRILGADIMIDNGRDLVTKLPKSCTNKWDFEGTVTHEWGHAYGMAHTTLKGTGHSNLTMQHVLSPCSTYARTLGLGDWLGMNKLYGHHH
jgi:hypothetical protein